MINYHHGTGHKLLVVIGVTILAILAVISINHASGPVPEVFTDVSWPNCDKTVAANFAHQGIIGVSGGLDFKLNPCLATETQWFAHYGLYVNTGYPGLAKAKKYSSGPINCNNDDYLCFAYDYGYQATEYDIHYADNLDLASPLWLLDVETDNSWSNNPLINRASLQGVIGALKQLTFRPAIGIYSTVNQWAVITDNWRPAYGAWLGTGSTILVAAVSACHDPSFTGGTVWFAQYTPYLDEDYVCRALPLWVVGE
ncbi:MAG TPA: hypothetical protein VMQ52_03600 [Candidatus Saccharimonadales bacterium]|jgi:hypothetical protein|nr:hypothetical protein [Candidatus Saccharimonadales bacterium]